MHFETASPPSLKLLAASPLDVRRGLCPSCLGRRPNEGPSPISLSRCRRGTASPHIKRRSRYLHTLSGGAAICTHQAAKPVFAHIKRRSRYLHTSGGEAGICTHQAAKPVFAHIRRRSGVGAHQTAKPVFEGERGYTDNAELYGDARRKRLLTGLAAFRFPNAGYPEKKRGGC